MRLLRKILIVIFTIAVIIGAFAGLGYTGYQYVQNQKKLNEKIRTTQAVRGDLKVVLKESATLKPKKSVEIKSKVNGRIVDLFYDAGAEIESGSVIAQLDREEYIRELELASKDLERAQQEWDGLTPFGEIVTDPEVISPTQTEKLVDQILIEYGARKVNYVNMRKMYARNLISEKALDDARISYETSWVAYHHAIRAATKALGDAELQYDQAEEDLRETTIKSPVSGVLTKVPVDEGELVQGTGGFSAGTVLAEVADLSEMEALVKLNEVDVGKVKVGNPVTLSIDSQEDVEFDGCVEHIAPSGTEVNNIVIFEVEIALKDRLPFFKPEMTANADILVDM
ncbi:MAG: HlyD family efflux transporter periplasmic adaptor subunit, partial [Candidatus Omnitrophica bacterium]|nr:HlyD family efflux transporter periplasmic adaptor subunit [Candidatus Omnitrophota bacterium]